MAEFISLRPDATQIDEQAPQEFDGRCLPVASQKLRRNTGTLCVWNHFEPTVVLSPVKRASTAGKPMCRPGRGSRATQSEIGNMQDDLTRAQRYLALAAQMWEAAEGESDPTRRRELLSLADQYERLANKLIGKGEAVRSQAGATE
jgi:hypothetical protein